MESQWQTHDTLVTGNFVCRSSDLLAHEGNTWTTSDGSYYIVTRNRTMEPVYALSFSGCLW